MEALAQPVDDRQQHGGIGGVARQHLGADRPALTVDDNGQDHLLQIRSMILGVAVSPQAVAAGAVERQAGGVHEDQRQIAEQIAPALEQALLDHVLDAARRQRAGSGGADLLAQPGHRPIEVMQLEPVDPLDPVIGDPFYRSCGPSLTRTTGATRWRRRRARRQTQNCGRRAARPTP
jgi:hypothetical protein